MGNPSKEFEGFQRQWFIQKDKKLRETYTFFYVSLIIL